MSSVVKFRKAPLLEVLFEIVFDGPEFTSTYFGIYWQTIKSKFPKALDKVPSRLGSEKQISLTFMPPLRKVWFISQDEQELIQVQNNYFAFNWRTKPDREYPHFEKLLSSFFEEWNHFKEELEKFDSDFKTINPSEYRLTYLNLIDENFGWSTAEDHSKIFEFIGEKKQQGILKSPKLFDCELTFELPNNTGLLSVSLDQRIRYEEGASHESEFVFFSLNATSEQINTSDEQHWYSAAHEYLVQAFLELTTEEIQEKWEKEIQ